MTSFIPWLLANWWLFVIALAFVIFLIAGLIFTLGWYLGRWVIQAHDEPEPRREYIAYGDIPHLPDDYWQKVAREEAKRRAG